MMNDLADGDKKIIVSTDGESGPYITLSNMMVAEAVVLLKNLGVSYLIDEEGIRLNGQTHIMVINIPGATAAKVAEIQNALDALE